MLAFAEHQCRASEMHQLELSTSEIQPAPLILYRSAGFEPAGEVIAEIASNKTIGGGIRRYYFKKEL